MKFTNLAKEELNSQLLVGGATFDLGTGNGAKFPAIGATNLFMGILWGAAFNAPIDDQDYEIVLCYRSNTDEITVVRAQEGTTAKQWEIGDNFMHTLTAGTLDRYETHDLTAKTTPVDADEFRIWDSVTGLFKKSTWANLKTNILSYLQGVFSSLAKSWDGWSASDETWTYASATTFTVPGDQTAKYHKGAKIKLTNNSAVKTFYVVTSTYSSPNTTVTVTGEVDLANSAITLPHYSYLDTPQGFKNGRDWYKARAYRNAAQNTTSGVDTKILYDTENWDINSNFNLTTSRYVAPISGYYDVSMRSLIGTTASTATGGVVAKLYKNGSQYNAGNISILGAASNLASVCISHVYLAKGDYLEGYVFHASGVNDPMNVAADFSNYITVNFAGV